MTVKDTVLHAKDNAVAKLQQSKDGAYRFKDDAVHRRNLPHSLTGWLTWATAATFAITAGSALLSAGLFALSGTLVFLTGFAVVASIVLGFILAGVSIVAGFFAAGVGLTWFTLWATKMVVDLTFKTLQKGSPGLYSTIVRTLDKFGLLKVLYFTLGWEPDWATVAAHPPHVRHQHGHHARHGYNNEYNTTTGYNTATTGYNTVATEVPVATTVPKILPTTTHHHNAPGQAVVALTTGAA
jgi:energy-coupling factor transporter transmembrane protein EcfT